MTVCVYRHLYMYRSAYLYIPVYTCIQVQVWIHITGCQLRSMYTHGGGGGVTGVPTGGWLHNTVALSL